MDQREQFERERKEYSGELSHIADHPGLREIDDLYGAADVLSLGNAVKHRRMLLELSAVGTLLTMMFLLYDEAELFGLIFACGAMILFLFLIRYAAYHSQCHRKYLEYRVLAESLRVQYYLFLSGVDVRVSELMPWSIKQGIPWVADMLSGLHIPLLEHTEPAAGFWIRDQRAYHESKLNKEEKKLRRDDRVAKATLVVAIFAYAVAMAFEIAVYQNLFGDIDANFIRSVIKVVVGTVSAITLFTGNYYGKMSLPNTIEDHKRMIALYRYAEERVKLEGENRELLIFLARECLNENSAWFAYQNKNKPDLVF